MSILNCQEEVLESDYLKIKDLARMDMSNRKGTQKGCYTPEADGIKNDASFLVSQEDDVLTIEIVKTDGIKKVKAHEF